MKNRIRILATSDVHAQVKGESLNSMIAEKGFARLNTLIESLRDSDTILLDNGDAFSGSTLSLHHELFHAEEPSPIATIMNGMKYDYLNVGFNDFTAGSTALKARLDTLNAPCITANVNVHDRPLGVTYAMHEAAGKKVAIIAVISDQIFRLKTKDQIRHCQFQYVVETVKKSVMLAKDLEKPDYIVCMIQGGFEADPANDVRLDDGKTENEAYFLLKSVPGIDVLIAGHSGRTLYGVTAKGTAYAQIHSEGTELVCVDLYTDTRTADVQVMKADADEDNKVLMSVDHETAECEAWLDEQLGTTKMDLTIPNLLNALTNKPQMITLMSHALKEKSGAQLTACSLSLETEGLPDIIKMRHVVSASVSPLCYSVRTISGKSLKYFLEATAEFYTVNNDRPTVSPRFKKPEIEYDACCFVDGISYTIHALEDPGSRISDLLFEGRPVTDEMSFTLCIRNDFVTVGGRYPMLAKLPFVRTVDQPMAIILSDYIKKLGIIDFEPENNIRITL